MTKNHRSGYVQRLFFLILTQKIKTKHREKWFKDIIGKKKEYGRIFGTDFFGVSRKFIDRIKSKYLSEKPDIEIPQKRHVLRDTNPKIILEKAAKVLKCNTNDFLQSSRISDSNKLNRDLLIYLLWSTGWYNNQEIGNLFGLGYSSRSRRVSMMKSKMSGEDEMNKRSKTILLRLSLFGTKSHII